MIGYAGTPRKMTVRCRLKRFLGRIWERIVSSEWCGGQGPPNDHSAYKWERHVEGGEENYRVVAWADDAFVLWIGWHDRWEVGIDRRHALRLAAWILWRWGWAEWFGFRRALFYWDLGRRMRGYPIWVPSQDRSDPHEQVAMAAIGRHDA